MLNILIPQDMERPQTGAPDSPSQLIRLGGETMGTNWSLACFADTAVKEKDILHSALSVFQDVTDQMSTWVPTSLISQFNQTPPGTLLTLPDAFHDVMSLALTIAETTNGAFNPCLGTQVAERGFGPAFMKRPEAQHSHSDAWRSLTLSRHTLSRNAPVQLDLSAIAKGYAVDMLAAALRQQGINRFLAEIGGEFRAGSEKPDGMPWWVDIETTEPGPTWRVALCGQSIASSGDYRKMRYEAGKSVSHIIPHPDRTSHSDQLSCVSVIHPSCACADSWATALFASGPQSGLALAEASGIAALFQFRGQPATGSSTLQDMMDTETL